MLKILHIQEEEKAFERLRKEFPKSHVSLDTIRCSWRDEPVYQAYASRCGDKLYENSAMVSSEDHLTADEAVDALIERREAEKKRRTELKIEIMELTEGRELTKEMSMGE